MEVSRKEASIVKYRPKLISLSHKQLQHIYKKPSYSNRGDEIYDYQQNNHHHSGAQEKPLFQTSPELCGDTLQSLWIRRIEAEAPISEL